MFKCGKYKKANMKKIFILGAGGHAKVVLDIALSMQQFEEIKIYDDYNKAALLSYEISGTLDDLLLDVVKNKGLQIIAIGKNEIRKSKFEYLLARNLDFGLLIHPRAIISPFATIHQGSVVMANAVINPATEIGCNVIINTSASIDHNCKIGSHAHIAPNATLCGGVEVGELSWVGAGSTVLEGVKIGKNCMIGAGAVVNKNVSDNSIVVGVPAKAIIKSREEK